MVPGLESGAALALRWDRREDFEPAEAADDGWIGEDVRGVWTTVHPLAALAREPLLWGIVSRWRHGVREMTPGLYRRLSAFEADGMVTLMSAHGREERRSLRGSQDGDA